MAVRFIEGSQESWEFKSLNHHSKQEGYKVAKLDALSSSSQSRKNTQAGESWNFIVHIAKNTEFFQDSKSAPESFSRDWDEASPQASL